MKRSFGNTFPLWSCGGVRTNETLVAVGIFGFGIPPAHPVKAKKEKDNWLEAVNARVAFGTFERGSSALYHCAAEFSRFLLLSFIPPKQPAGT